MRFRRSFTRRTGDGLAPVRARRLDVCAGLVVAVTLVGLGATGFGQPAPPRTPNAFTVLGREGRPSLPTTVVNGQEFVSLDDLARVFQLTVREDQLAGGLSVAARGKVMVLSSSQGLASIGGRLVSLSSAPVKQGRTWLVPLDTLARALPLLLDTRIDVRRGSRLVLVGDVKVPHVTVRAETQAATSRLIFDITPTTPHTIDREPNRLTVRFQADAVDAAIPALAPTDLVASVHTLESATAIAIELGPAFASFRATDQAGDQNASRLVIDVLATTSSTPATPTPPAPAAPTPTPSTPEAPQPPLLFEPPTSALRTIVIDPGHGGEETGAKGPSGAFEKDVALSVARQLRSLLESRLGVRVILTRDSDDTVGLDQRAALANNNKADVFVSIHANASVRSSVHGAQVFYLSADEYNADARQQAALEGELLPIVSGGERQVEFILWEMAQLQHLQDSSMLATFMEQQLRARVTMGPAAVQQAPFRVLVGANMPAVLVELGFMTNADEEKLLTSPAHQGTLAQALYDTLLRFRSYLEGGRRPATVTGTSAPRTPGSPNATPPRGH